MTISALVAPDSPDRVRAAVTSANSSVVSWVASVSSSAKSRRWGWSPAGSVTTISAPRRSTVVTRAAVASGRSHRMRPMNRTESSYSVLR